MIHAIEQAIERYLPGDITSIAAFAIDLVGIPFTEHVIGAAIGGVAMIVGPRIEGQFFERLQIEAGFVQNGRFRFGKNLQGPADQFAIAAPGRTRSTQPQGDRPHTFMLIRFTARPRFENGDGAMADEIVELPQSAGDDAAFIVPRTALHQHRFHGDGKKVRRKKILVRLMEKQILVVLAIGGQEMLKYQLQNGFRLSAIAKGCLGFAERLQPESQNPFERFVGACISVLLDDCISVAQTVPKARIGLAGCKIEIAQQSSERRSAFQLRQQLVHATHPTGQRPSLFPQAQN